MTVSILCATCSGGRTSGPSNSSDALRGMCAVRWPREVLAEFGTYLPEDVRIRVHDSTAAMRYLVLPMRPAGTEHLDEAALASLVTRDAMIGVTLVRGPAP